MTHCALIIDDEADIRELIAISLQRIGLDTHTAANLAEAKNLLSHYRFDVCLSDLRLPDGNGVEFVKHIHEVQPDLPVAVITAHGDVKAAVNAMKNGAFDFVSKPVDLRLLRGLVVQAIDSGPNAANDCVADKTTISDDFMPEGTASLAENRDITTDGKDLIGSETLIGQSPLMKDLKKMISKVAKSNAPVWIHKNSARASAPFVAVNCGAIPSELMESEMFGHQKGSFTGAINDSEGLFKGAHNGTLFLDEVAELPLPMQVKLLRVIQERAVKPVGSSIETNVNVRILSASHVNLADAVKQGTFRNDLYYRLNVICIESPPLRSRLEDIPLLAQFIMSRSGQKELAGANMELSADALEALSKYDFPGNIRELENLLERACALCENEIISADDLALNTTKFCIERAASASKPSLSGDDKHIMEVLDKTRWNRREAAKTLGISYRQLRYRIQKMGLEKRD
jgi:two-component system response regulator PilR (NtrC family)